MQIKFVIWNISVWPETTFGSPIFLRLVLRFIYYHYITLTIN